MPQTRSQSDRPWRDEGQAYRLHRDRYLPRSGRAEPATAFRSTATTATPGSISTCLQAPGRSPVLKPPVSPSQPDQEATPSPFRAAPSRRGSSSFMHSEHPRRRPLHSTGSLPSCLTGIPCSTCLDLLRNADVGHHCNRRTRRKMNQRSARILMPAAVVRGRVAPVIFACIRLIGQGYE